MKYLDKILFGLGFVIFLAIAGWVFTQQKNIASLRSSISGPGAKPTYAPANIEAPIVTTTLWPEAPAQTRGAKWIFDVFTPPEIFYDTVTKQFILNPDEKPPKPTEELKPFGVKLVAIKTDDFRLQLVGYVGNNVNDYRGTFINPSTNETFLAQEGRESRKLNDLGLALKKFEVIRTRTTSTDSMPVYETIATATIEDKKSGEIIILTNKARRLNGPPLALLKADSGEEFTQKTDSSFKVGEIAYKVLSVTETPPAARLSKYTPNTDQTVEETLTISEPVKIPAVPPSVESQPAVLPKLNH